MARLSSDYNNDIVDDKLKIGSVISLDCVGIDHPKWNIILDVTEDMCLIASVFINSEIYFKHVNNPELERLQLTISKEQYNFLDHDSIIDCSQLYEKPYQNYKQTLLTSGAARKKGDISETDLEKIYELVRTSKNITGKTKKRFKKLFGSSKAE